MMPRCSTLWYASSRLALIWWSASRLPMIIDSAAFEFAPPLSLDEARDLAARYVIDLPEDGPSDEARRDGSLH